MAISKISPSDAAWAEATDRLRRAEQAARASQPKICPSCGSDKIGPVFDPDLLLWSCDVCSDVFPERD